uniref:Cobalt-precorrin-5B C(1)-methyltransferase n=1 Tax=Desulfacinum infernum TaxID=35837 RepID=A0A832A4E7_9BACT
MQGKGENGSEDGSRRKRLRTGFSTGTAMTAAARAALRRILSGKAPSWVAVRLPVGYYLAVPTAIVAATDLEAEALVIKDAGDDPDVTHKAAVLVRVSLTAVEGQCSEFPRAHPQASLGEGAGSEIRLCAGPGVGVVTKPGLAVPVGEPAINPVPRQMLAENMAEELERSPWGVPLESLRTRGSAHSGPEAFGRNRHVRLALPRIPGLSARVLLDVRVSIAQGEELARRTLNPRLGIHGGLSVLGTTGLVKPLSHEAYEETIAAALAVAKAGGCPSVVLSTGGKSEKLARKILDGEPDEAFVQIADFFAFAVREAARMGFDTVVHSVFFGKAVKMASGLPYTHAHKAAMDLKVLVRCGERVGAEPRVLERIAQANTARHALEILLQEGIRDVVRAVAEDALRWSRRFAGAGVRRLRLLLFDYEGRILADVAQEGGAEENTA